ncbi:MAG: response regulator [bacterium]
MAKILIADRDETLRNLIEEVLVRDGNEVGHVDDGTDAFYAIRDDNYDLVILEYKMPSLTCLEILARLQMENALVPPTMILSTKGSADVIRECIEAGARDFVLKPVEMPVLIQRIKKLLKR